MERKDGRDRWAIWKVVWKVGGKKGRMDVCLGSSWNCRYDYLIRYLEWYKRSKLLLSRPSHHECYCWIDNYTRITTGRFRNANFSKVISGDLAITWNYKILSHQRSDIHVPGSQRSLPRSFTSIQICLASRNLGPRGTLARTPFELDDLHTSKVPVLVPTSHNHGTLRIPKPRH